MTAPLLMRLSRLPSRTPTHPVRTALRVDPYWSSMWRAGSTGDWLSSADLRRLEAAGAAKVPAWLCMEEQDALARIYSERNREQVLRTVAALDLWRTMTVQQVEGLTDVTGLAAGDVSLLSALWNAGLVDISIPAGSFASRGLNRGTVLLRPGRNAAAATRLEEHMSFVEWVSVTSGLGLTSDRQYARHNVLASEFGLRVAEHCHVAMVLGEKLSGMDLLAYSSVGDPVPSTGADGASDLTIIRADGLRIAVEITASKIGPWFNAKVEKLVRILQYRSLTKTGLSVLFVTAPHQDSSPADATAALNGVKKAVQRAVHNYPGTYRDPTAKRVAVASWTSFFPHPDMAVTDFAKLPVERPIGPGYLGNRNASGIWERAHLLDPRDTPLAPDDAAALTSVVYNASGLRGAPHMLRKTEGRPVLSDLTVRAMGFERIPQASGTMPLTAARGASGSRSLPPRLRY